MFLWACAHRILGTSLCFLLCLRHKCEPSFIRTPRSEAAFSFNVHLSLLASPAQVCRNETRFLRAKLSFNLIDALPLSLVPRLFKTQAYTKAVIESELLAAITDNLLTYWRNECLSPDLLRTQGAYFSTHDISAA